MSVLVWRERGFGITMRMLRYILHVVLRYKRHVNFCITASIFLYKTERLASSM